MSTISKILNRVNITNFQTEYAINYNQFKNAITEKANDPSYRILCNFARGPLFFCDQGTLFILIRLGFWYSFRSLLNGHWSPIIGYLELENVVVILDTNNKYGTYLVSLDRLWEACATCDFGNLSLFSKPSVRGIIIVEL